MPFIKINDFKGTNTEQENLNPNVLPFAFNVDTSKNRLTKRAGYTSLLDLGTTGSPKGIHTAKFSDGETIVVGADDKAFKLSGTAETEEVTDTVDFDLGTFDNTESDDVDRNIDNTTSDSSTSTNYDYIGQTFSCEEMQYISNIGVYLGSSASANFVLTLYDDVSKTTTLGSVTVPEVSDGTYDFAFASDVDVSSYDDLYFEVAVDDVYPMNDTYYNTDYADGQAYFEGVAQSYDLRFSVTAYNEAVIQSEYYSEDFHDTTYTLSTAFEEFTSSVQFDIDLESGETETGRMYFYDSSDAEQFQVYRYANESGTDIFKIYEFGIEVFESTQSIPDTCVETIKVIKTSDEVEFYSDQLGGLVYTSTTSFNDIKKVEGDSSGSTDDFNIINFYIAESLTGEYISKIFDLGQTPVLNTLSFNTTTAGEGTLSIYARGSDDGVRFNDWGIVSASGGGINLKRYIQVRALFARTDLTVMSSASLDDFTISYTTAFDTATQFDSGLTGNKIRWVNYQGQKNTTTGTIVIATDPKILTVDDGSAFSTGQTLIIQGAGLSGADLIATVDTAVGTTITLVEDALTDVTDAYVLIELYETKQYVYYCDGDKVAKYDGTTQTDIDTVISANIIYEHKNYMFYVSSVDPTRLYFSDVYGTTQSNPLGDFENVSSTAYKKFPSEIKGVKTFEGKLVVSGPDFTAFVTGDIFGGSSDNTVIYIIDDIGVVDHESMSICVNTTGTILSLVTNDGVRYLSGSSYENALQQRPLSETVQTYIEQGTFDTAYSYYSDNKLYVGFNSGVVPTDYVDSILVFDFTNGLTIDGIWDVALNDVCKFNGKLYGTSSDTTKIFELLSGENDDGSDIEMKAVMRLQLEEYEASLMNLKIKATTDSDFDNPTSCDIIISADNHARTLDLKQSKWRESTTYYAQFKGQDLMESRRNINKRGTFIEINIVSQSSYKLEFDSFEIEYGGVRK